MQAQYFRDPSQMDTYLESNLFLPDINNEVQDSRNETYAHNLAGLNNLVLVLFTRDKTVVPKESAWFGSEAADDKDDISHSALKSGYGDDHLSQITMDSPHSSSKTIIPMRLQPLYQNDWIGLRELDERGAVVLETCEGEHMQMGECWEGLVKRFVGSIPE